MKIVIARAFCNDENCLAANKNNFKEDKMNSEPKLLLDIDQTEILYKIQLYLESPYFQRKPKDSKSSDEEYAKSVTYGHNIIGDSVSSKEPDDFIDRFSEGYCHGISVLWAYSKWLQTQPKTLTQDGQEIARDDNDWFNYMIKLLVSWDGSSELTNQECLEINRFIYYIQYFQNINDVVSSVLQSDLVKSLEDTQNRNLKPEYSIAALFTLEQLKQLFSEKDFIKPGKIILISSCDHATALFKENEIYYYFDPNCKTGEVEFLDLDKLASCIFQANWFQDDKPSPLGLKIFTFDQVDENYTPQSVILTKIKPDLGTVEEESDKEYSGLKQAIKTDSLESARFFLEQYDKVGVSDVLINEAFIYAVSIGRIEIIKEFLVKKRVDLSITDDDGDNMLMCAIKHDQPEVVRALLATQEFDPNEPDEDRERTPFMYAVVFGYADVVKVMLESRQIDLSLTDGCGTSALGIALTKGYIEGIVKDILETFIPEDQVDEKNTALMCAAASDCFSRDLNRILEFNNNSKEYINRQNSKGFTALMFAAINNHPDIVDKLLASGADPSITNNYGEDAFMIASKKGYSRIVEMLKPKELTISMKIQ